MVSAMAVISALTFPAYHGLKVQSRPRGFLHFQSEAKARKISVAVCSSRIKEFQLKELNEATNSFLEQNKVGAGGTADVFKATLDGKSVAIKRVWPEKHDDGRPTMYDPLAMFNQELSILANLNPHPNIVNLVGYAGGFSGERYLVLELLKSDLYSLVKESDDLAWRLRLEIAKSIAVGTLYMHDKGYLHLDLKSQNILVDDTFLAKLTDFGLSVRISDRVWDSMATHIIDPVYRRTGIYGPYVDVYAFGIILFELLTGNVRIGMAISTLREDWEFDGDWPIVSAERLGRLAYRCTDDNVEDRPDFREILLELDDILIDD